MAYRMTLFPHGKQGVRPFNVRFLNSFFKPIFKMPCFSRKEKQGHVFVASSVLFHLILLL